MISARVGGMMANEGFDLSEVQKMSSRLPTLLISRSLSWRFGHLCSQRVFDQH